MAVVANPLVVRIFINSTLTGRENGWAERWPIWETDWDAALSIALLMVQARQRILSSNAYIQWGCLGTVVPPYYEQTVVTDPLFPLPQWGPAAFDMQGVLFDLNTEAGENAPRLIRAVEGSEIYAKQWTYGDMTIPFVPPLLPADPTAASKELLWQNSLATLRKYTSTQQPMEDGHHGPGDGYWVGQFAQMVYRQVSSRRWGRPWKRVSWEATPYADAPQFSPCGTVVTVNRTCYTIPCRLGPGWSLRNIRYYFAKLGAEVMTFKTPFCCWNRSLEYDTFTGVGEARKFRRADWTNGSEIGDAPGTIWTGPASYFGGYAPEPPIPTPSWMLPGCDVPVIRVGWLPLQIATVPSSPELSGKEAGNQWSISVYIAPPPPPPAVPFLPRQSFVVPIEEAAEAKIWQWSVAILPPAPTQAAFLLRQQTPDQVQELPEQVVKQQWSISVLPTTPIAPPRQEFVAAQAEEVPGQPVQQQRSVAILPQPASLLISRQIVVAGEDAPLPEAKQQRSVATMVRATPLAARPQFVVMPPEGTPSPDAKNQWNIAVIPVVLPSIGQWQPSAAASGVTQVRFTWSPSTATGSMLYAAFVTTGNPTITAPSGWTLIAHTAIFSVVTLHEYYAAAAASQGSSTFTWTGALNAVGSAVEIQNLGSSALDTTAASNTGTSSSAATNSSGTLASTRDVAIACVASAFGNASATSWTNSFATGINDSGLNLSCDLGYLLCSSTSAVSTTATINVSLAWLTRLTTFK